LVVLVVFMLRLYNTLSHTIEDFVPINPPKVGIYSCGPTVYDYQHIGHMRRYVGDDILVRVLKHNGYDVKHVMNITDVGHLVSDADTGEDKMEKGAAKFGMSVWDIAKKFEEQFFDSEELLNIKRPDIVIHATDAIGDQIELISILEEKGYTYKTTDGMYFDTSKFPRYFDLSGQNPQALMAGARVEMITGKKNISDFALWKFSYPNGRSLDSVEDAPRGTRDDTTLKRAMEWDSPWGTGFPGWHIECSAMSMKSLGSTLDIHTGGIDHITIHHTNEIAQSESASGKKFVNYWVHHNFLTVDTQKMSKSLGNFYTVEDIKQKGFEPLALRYLYFQTHYRQEMNFTFGALSAAQTALFRLYEEVVKLGMPKKESCTDFEQRFFEALNEDVNMPKAIGIMWEMLNSKRAANAKVASLLVFDDILGLNLWDVLDIGFKKKEEKIPQNILDLAAQRNALRKERRFHLADEVRSKIEKLGYTIDDKKGGKTEIKKI